MTKRRVAHLIVGLGLGGAETMLYQVMKHRSSDDIEYRVISLGASHYYEQPIRELGIKVIELPMKNRPFTCFYRLVKELQDVDTLCCWMYHANLFGFYAGKLAKVSRIIWCIRHSSLDEKTNSKLTLAINRHCAKLSSKVTAITYNGKRSRKVHEALGYCRDAGLVLDNGCDCSVYKPDGEARESLRKELSISPDATVILSVTRDHPIKDVPTFLNAFSIFRNEMPMATAVMCGRGIDDDNQSLVSACAELGLSIGRDIHLLGVRHDVERLMAATDLYVMHSAGEAFPNTLIQAMACECLCLATDVGDAKVVLASDSQVVIPGEPTVLSQKMKELIELKTSAKEFLRKKARIRVQNYYSIERVAKEYENLF